MVGYLFPLAPRPALTEFEVPYDEPASLRLPMTLTSLASCAGSLTNFMIFVSIVFISDAALMVLCPGRFKPPIHRRGSYDTVRSYLVPVATVCPRASARIGSLLHIYFFIATRPLASPWDIVPYYQDT